MNKIFKDLGSFGIVPVVVLKNPEDARPLGKALCDGGLPCAEITFRTQGAAKAIETMTRTYPRMFIGAGTVLTPEQADEAMAAGAKFIVSPGLNPTVVRHCQAKDYPICPGVMTPSEIEQALAFGLDLVKFFPAQPAGGLAMLKALAAPYTSLSFMPTGGITQENVREYLSFDRILACGGSWMVKESLINDGDFKAITALTKKAVQLVRSIREG